MYTKVLNSWRLLWIAYFLLLWPSIVADSVDSPAGPKSPTQQAQSPTPAQKKPSRKSKEKPPLHAISLTSSNFGSHIIDGNVWLIEFYTPSCRYCVAFAESYNNVAATFHSSPQEGIRVGKVDCQVEKALLARFGVDSFPSFFLVDGWSVYKFEETRSQAALLDFARGGYKKQQPLPYLSSPMGPMGLFQGILTSMGSSVLGWFQYLEESYRASPIVMGFFLSFCSLFAGFIFVSIVALLVMPKTKLD